jgi:hypothetical protein
VRIEALRKETREGRSAVHARIVWEESSRPPFELRFETTAPPDGLEEIGGNPFLVACAHSARSGGERRIRIEDSVCPLLHDGIRTAMRILAGWYGGPAEVVLEAAKGLRAFPTRAPRAGLFLSCGVDSLHALLTNRRIFSADHPSAFRDAVHVPFFSFPDPFPDERARDIASRQRIALETIGKRTGLDLCVVETNAGAVEPDFDLHVLQSHGASLIAAAHVLTARVGTVSIASSFDAPRALRPYGSHPVLDSAYGSSGLAVSHDGIGYTRLEKVRELAGWAPARDSLMVCFEGPLPDGRLNCGRCEKCLRTMTALSIAGGLERFAVFGTARPDVESIEKMPIGYHPHAFAHYWEPMGRSLHDQGRRDLSRAVARRVAEARRLHDWLSERDWKGRLRRFDRRFLGERLSTLARGWRTRGSIKP